MTTLHGDARESSGSWCRPVAECLVVARNSQYHCRTRRRASGPQHLLLWSASLEGALGRLSSRPRGTREEVLLQGPARALDHQNCHSSRDVHASALRGMCRIMVGRHDKPRRRANRTQLERIRGSARAKSAPIERICVSATQVKEGRQRSRKRAPRWWLAAAKPDLDGSMPASAQARQGRPLTNPRCVRAAHMGMGALQVRAREHRGCAQRVRKGTVLLKSRWTSTRPRSSATSRKVT